MFWAKIADESLAKASIGGIRLRLQELQEWDTQVQKIRLEELEKEGWNKVKRVLHLHEFSFVQDIIWT